MIRAIGNGGKSPLSPGVEVGELVFVSGQVGTDPKTGSLEAGIEAQARMALSRLEAILRDGGLSLTNVVKTTVYLSDVSQVSLLNSVYTEFFAPPFPARTTIGVQLPKPGLLVEIDAIAVRGK